MYRVKRNWIAGLLALLALAGAASFRAVAEPENDFHFSIIGDRTGSASAQIYGRIWREIDMLHPNFVINVGDTIQGGGDQLVEGQWKQLRPLWERYKHFSLYFTPGNHDVFSDTSERVFVRETTRPTCYSFNYQNAHFTVLDNSRTTELSPAQLEFLEKDLKENPARRPKFIFFHKPYWIPLVGVASAEFPLHRLVKKYSVDYVVSGHGHQFVRLPFDGVVYLEVGSSGATLDGKMQRGLGFRDGLFYHHVWGYVKGAKVSLVVKELDGQRGHGRMFRAEDWDQNGPRFDTGDPALTDKPIT